MGKELIKNCYAAIDLGASSGRIVVGYIKNKKLQLKEIFRFDNIQKRSNGHDCWNLPMIEKNIIKGLAECIKYGFEPKTIGIDTWGVDFVGIDKNGDLVGDAVAYRDIRTDGIMDENKPMTFEQIYEHCGIQKLPFNTIYQFVALKRENFDLYKKTDKFLMIPEYLMYKFTGKKVAEYTNCSTTSMINAYSRVWDKEIFNAFELDNSKFLTPQMPGKVIGKVTDEIATQIGYKPDMVLVATHDTGSAYISIPTENQYSANLSSGTWSLLGCNILKAITNKAAMQANFTNEGGYQGKIRFLKNIMGLWIIQSVRRELNGIEYTEESEIEKDDSLTNKDVKFEQLKKKLSDVKNKKYGFADLAKEAKKAKYFNSCFDVNDDRFLSPKSMISQVQKACEDAKLAVPRTVGQLLNCIYNSLANCYLKELKLLESVIGYKITSLNIVGGGCQDKLLNQITANVTGIDVYAGPIEGTSIGNLCVQLLVDGVLKNDTDIKHLVKKSFKIEHYKPQL